MPFTDKNLILRQGYGNSQIALELNEHLCTLKSIEQCDNQCHQITMYENNDVH